MKKTKYFYARQQYTYLDDAMISIIEERDEFIKDNLSKIAKIDSEDMKITNLASNQILVVIRLTYYPKK